MTKLQTAFASLAAVVPAGVLAYVIITGMISNLDAITSVMPLMATVVIALLCCLGIVFMPAIVFLVNEGSDADEVDEFDDASGADASASGEFETLDDEFDDFDDEGEETLVSDDLDMDATQDFDGDEDWGDDEWDDEEEWDDKD